MIMTTDKMTISRSKMKSLRYLMMELRNRTQHMKRLRDFSRDGLNLRPLTMYSKELPLSLIVLKLESNLVLTLMISMMTGFIWLSLKDGNSITSFCPTANLIITETLLSSTSFLRGLAKLWKNNRKLIMIQMSGLWSKCQLLLWLLLAVLNNLSY
jgi:hypothetical protein